MKQDIENIPVENFIKQRINNCVGIDLSQNKIKDLNFFDQLPDFKDLMEIKFNQNKINYISPRILDFKNLKSMEFRNNNLLEFMEDINFEIISRKIEDNNTNNNPKLQINHNFNNPNMRNKTNNSSNIKQKFNEMGNNNNEENPEEINSFNNNNILPNLEYLDISVNKLKNIPTIVKYLNKLNTLILTNNQINSSEFLKEIKNPQLFTIELGTNKIINLPEKIYLNIPNIKHIGMENNELRSIPTDLCILKNINKITLNGNPLKQLRSNIISGGTKTILEYLRKMHKFTEEEISMEGNKSSFLNFDNHMVKEEKFGGRKRAPIDGNYINQNLTSPQNDFKNNTNSDHKNTNNDYNSNNINNNRVSNFNLEENNNNNNNFGGNRNINNNNFNENFNQNQNDNNNFNYNSNNNNLNNNNNFNNNLNENENMNMNMQENNINNNNFNNNNFNDNSNSQMNNNQNIPMSIDSELDIVNQEILGVEAEMGEGNLPMFKKTDLRKKLNELIRKRANIMKKMN